jgi:hypothetical protein
MQRCGKNDMGNTHTAELDQAEDRLRMLSARLLQMQDDERRRIARELQDTVGQILVALNLNLVPVEEELRKTNSVLLRPITESLRLVEELSFADHVSSTASTIARPGRVAVGRAPPSAWEGNERCRIVHSVSLFEPFVPATL